MVLPSLRQHRRRLGARAFLVVALFSALLAPPLSAAPEPGTPLVVNSTGTGNDNNTGDGICNTGGTNSAGQPECTLEAAIRETNQSNANHIHFNIPTSDPGYNGTRWRISLNSTLPSIGVDTEIEANTQPGFTGTPVIEIHNTGNASTGLRFSNANGGSAEYLSITNFTSHGIELSNADNMRIANNYIGVTALHNAGNLGGNGVHLIGGSDNNVVANNTIGLSSGHGIAISGGSENTSIDGNFIGTIRGENMSNNGDGIHVSSGSHGTTIGATEGNVISNNGNDGIHLDAIQRAEVYNNTIGLLFSRRNRVPNGGHGIHLTSGASATIGSAAAPNTISGNTLSGVAVINSSADIIGNFIGTNPNGKGLGNWQSGVVVVDSGSVTNIVDNAIQANGDDGVTVRSQSVFISQNSILDNDDQSIDLNADGFTPNDPGDGDGGRNNQLNFPEIADLSPTSVTLDIDVPTGNYTIELFEHAPFENQRFRDTDHYIRSFPFTSNGTATTQTFTGFTATAGHVFSTTITNSGLGITSETSPTSIVSTAATTNRPPTLQPIPDQETNEGDFETITATATDPDGDQITYNAIGLPAGFTINPNTGVISGTPPFSSSDQNITAVGLVTVTANDGTQTVTQTFFWRIPNVEQTSTTTTTPPTNPTPETTPSRPTTTPVTPTTPDPTTPETTPGRPTTSTPQSPGQGSPQTTTRTETPPSAVPFETDTTEAEATNEQTDTQEEEEEVQDEEEAGSIGNEPEQRAEPEPEPANLAISATAIIEDNEPELASISGLTIRSRRIVSDLVNIRLSNFQLSSLSLAPLMLLALYTALRRRPKLISINRISLADHLPQEPIDGAERPIRHDQLLWSTNRTRIVKNEPQTLIEAIDGGHVWVPTTNIINTGY